MKNIKKFLFGVFAMSALMLSACSGSQDGPTSQPVDESSAPAENSTSAAGTSATSAAGTSATSAPGTSATSAPAPAATTSEPEITSSDAGTTPTDTSSAPETTSSQAPAIEYSEHFVTLGSAAAKFLYEDTTYNTTTDLWKGALKRFTTGPISVTAGETIVVVAVNTDETRTNVYANEYNAGNNVQGEGPDGYTVKETSTEAVLDLYQYNDGWAFNLSGYTSGGSEDPGTPDTTHSTHFYVLGTGAAVYLDEDTTYNPATDMWGGIAKFVSEPIDVTADQDITVTAKISTDEALEVYANGSNAQNNVKGEYGSYKVKATATGAKIELYQYTTGWAFNLTGYTPAAPETKNISVVASENWLADSAETYVWAWGTGISGVWYKLDFTGTAGTLTVDENITGLKLVRLNPSSTKPVVDSTTYGDGYTVWNSIDGITVQSGKTMTISSDCDSVSWN